MSVSELVPKINADVSVDTSAVGKDGGLVHQGEQGVQVQIDSPSYCPILIVSADRCLDNKPSSGWRIYLVVVLILLGIGAAYYAGRFIQRLQLEETITANRSIGK